MYAITDEDGMFTYEDGIKKCGKEFFYTPTLKPERWYTNSERANKALECIKLHNITGKVGHIFKIVLL